MVIRTGQTREPQTTLYTSNYCVAYLDILGGVNKIKADKDNKFLNLLNMLYVDVFNEAQGIFNEDKDIVVKIFSDNILLAIQIEKESPEKEKRVQRLLNAVSNIYNEALRYGVLLRGAIAVGDLFINEVFVYGNALLDVYKMESKIAIYPRVLVSKEIYELLPHYCLPSEDGLPFLNNFLFSFTNELNYPTFIDKLTHLFFGACKFHCFEDGNKRIAITLSAHFLLLNGYMAVAKDFFVITENISYEVASGKISKELLHRIMTSIMDGTYNYNEELKLEIYNAIQ